MPQAVAGWIIGALGVSATGLAAAAINVAVGLVSSIALSKLTQPKGRSPKDNQIEMRQSNAPRTRYLGRNRVSGAVMYWDTHSRALWKLWAVAQGGMTDVQRWYIGDDEVTVVDGTVTTGDSAGKVSLWWRNGIGANGGGYTALIGVAPAWTPQHRLDGVGTILMRASNVKAEDAQKFYPGGEPNVTAEIMGANARRPNGGAPAPTENLAVQLYDILTHPQYGVLTDANIDLPSWMQAISDCADLVPTAGGNRRRFSGGGGYQLAEPIKDVAERWLAGMAGNLFLTTDGKVGLRVGKWADPVYTITADKIVSIEYGAGDRLDGVAALVPKFTSRALKYAETSADAWEDAAAIARWGETAAKDLPLPVVHHHGQARHLAKIALAKANPKWRITARLRFWGLLLLDQDRVYVDLPNRGIARHPFWIEEFSFDLSGEEGVCSVTLVSADPASMTVVAAHDGTAPTVPAETGGGRTPLDPPVVGSVVVVSDDGPPFIRVTVTVSDVMGTLVGQYRKSGSTGPWTSMIPEGIGGSLRTLPLEDASEYDIRVAVSAVFIPSASESQTPWVTITNIEVVDKAIPPDAPVVVSTSGTTGGPYSVAFEPDLGVNYELTRLYRAGPTDLFPAATVVATTRSTAQQVTLKSTIPAGGARFWLRSENQSGVGSAVIGAGTYT